MGCNSTGDFEATVAENLRRGLLMTQRDVLIACIRDNRLGDKDRLVLVAVVERMNASTGMAFPGRRCVTEDVSKWAANKRGCYTEAGVAKSISKLIGCGYLMYDRRAPEGGRKAIAHYTVCKPSIEDLEAQIAETVARICARNARGGPAIQARFDFGDDTPHAGHVSPADVPSQEGNVTTSATADVTPSHPADETPSAPIVTRKEELGSETSRSRGASDPDKTGRPKGRPRTGIAKDWKPDNELIAWVQRNYEASLDDIAVETQKFRDHHAAHGKTMADWAAAWRTWWGTGFHKIARRTGSADTPLLDAAAVTAAKEAGERQALARAMRDCYPVGGSDRRPWPAHELGPAPGQPGCRLPAQEQAKVWRELLDATKRTLRGNYTPDVMGFGVGKMISLWWRFDPIAGRCPIPRELLAEFRVPVTAEQFAAAKAAHAAQRAAAQARSAPAAEPPRHTAA
jgi:hypothetical protein